MTTTAPCTGAPCTGTVVLDEDDILIEFARIMMEWGHYKTASGLRYPTCDEVRGTCAERTSRRQQACE